MFFKIHVLRNFAYFVGNFNQRRCFAVEFAKFLRKGFFKEHFRWLLQYLDPLKFINERCNFNFSGGISSNVNEVVRAVLNFLFFLRKDFTRTQKDQKHKDATKRKHKHYKQTKIKSALKTHLREKKVTYSLIYVFVLFVHAKKRT